MIHLYEEPKSLVNVTFSSTWHSSGTVGKYVCIHNIWSLLLCQLVNPHTPWTLHAWLKQHVLIYNTILKQMCTGWGWGWGYPPSVLFNAAMFTPVYWVPPPSTTRPPSLPQRGPVRGLHTSVPPILAATLRRTMSKGTPYYEQHYMQQMHWPHSA